MDLPTVRFSQAKRSFVVVRIATVSLQPVVGLQHREVGCVRAVPVRCMPRGQLVDGMVRTYAQRSECRSQVCMCHRGVAVRTSFPDVAAGIFQPRRAVVWDFHPGIFTLSF